MALKRYRLIRPYSQAVCADTGREVKTGQVLMVDEDRAAEMNTDPANLATRRPGPAGPWFEAVGKDAKDMTAEEVEAAKLTHGMPADAPPVNAASAQPGGAPGALAKGRGEK